MLKLLEMRELGILLPRQVVVAETTRRSLNLHLSNFISVEPIHTSAINCLSIDPSENRYLLSCDASGLVHIHDLHNMSKEPRYQCPCISSSTHEQGTLRHTVDTVQWYSHDNGLFHSSGAEKKLKVWDTNCMKVAAEFEFTGPVYTHQMSLIATRHSLLAIGYVGSHTRLVDLKTSSNIHSLPGHGKATLAVSWSPSQEFILATAGSDSRICVWDVRKANGCLMVMDKHNGDTTASSRSVKTAHDGRVNSLLYLPDGLHLLSTGTDDTLRLWNAQTGLNCLVNYGHVSNESRKNIRLSCSGIDTRPCLAFVPTGSDIDVYDIFSGEHLSSLRGHYGRVNGCVFNTESQDLYSCSNDRSVLVWTPECEAVAAYERHLKGEDREREDGWVGRGVKRKWLNGGAGDREYSSNRSSRGVMADSWSSDED